MPAHTEFAITSSHNPRIKALRRLVASRRERMEAQQIVVEGVRLIDDALRSGVMPLAIFYAPALIAGNPLASALIERMLAAGVACFSCTEAVFASVAETVTPQGVLALLPMPRRHLPPAPALILLLDGVRDPGNAGALLRSAEAAGADAVIFGPGTVDPFNDKVLRGAMGAHFRLPLVVADDWQTVRALVAGLSSYVAVADQGRAYDQVDWRSPAALVVGGEADGPGQAAFALGQPIHIPMLGAPESLNAAMAGSIILFEAARQRRAG